MPNETKDFDVTIAQSDTEQSENDILKTKYQRLERAAMESFMNNTSSISSVSLNEGQSPEEDLTYDEIIELGTSPQTSLSKTMRIASRNLLLANVNDIVGRVMESINSNINTDIKLTYEHQEDGRNKKKKFTEAQQLIHDFNDSINLPKLIRNSVTTAYLTGNWVSYLRTDKDEYVVDSYPLGVVEISEYEVGGNPIAMFSIQNLRSRLQKTYRKTKKNKALFYDNINKEVEANYCKEVVDAFKAGEAYAPLDYKYTGVIRIGRFERTYGCSPILRAYLPLRIIQNLENADDTNSKARARKIIAQIMRPELIKDDARRDTFPQQSYAHANMANAFSNRSLVLVTCPPTISDVKYVEPSVEMTSVDTYNYYRSKVLSTLGISFLMDSKSQSVSTASISVDQLLNTINSITEQFEEILFRWYRQILIDNGFDSSYAPHVKIGDAHKLEQALKIEWATFLYNVLGASRQTIFDELGLNVEDEFAKRNEENELNYNETFQPYGTAYTNSGSSSANKDKGGRPRGELTDKQVYDDEEGKNK